MSDDYPNAQAAVLLENYDSPLLGPSDAVKHEADTLIQTVMQVAIQLVSNAVTPLVVDMVAQDTLITRY